MHDQGMIHGDLKGVRLQMLIHVLSPNTLSVKVNILVSQNGLARLADFGLLTFISNPTNFTASSPGGHGTTQWMSPELLDPEKYESCDGKPTKESDCYALGMVIYEVLSGKAPFISSKGVVLKRKGTIERMILEGERPMIPEGSEGAWFSGDLLGILNLCWAAQPKSRPSIEAVHKCLKQVSGTWKPPSSQIANEDAEKADSDWDLSGSSGFLFLTPSPYSCGGLHADRVSSPSAWKNRLRMIYQKKNCLAQLCDSSHRRALLRLFTLHEMKIRQVLEKWGVRILLDMVKMMRGFV